MWDDNDNEFGNKSNNEDIDRTNDRTDFTMILF